LVEVVVITLATTPLACDDGGGNEDPDAAADAGGDGGDPRCGDEVIDEGELCDDGNTNVGDGCRADCLGLEVCGDGLLDPGELCDDGDLGDDLECATDCTPAAPFHEYDQIILDFMERWRVPGGAVAVTTDERLVLVRAYGMADVEAEEPVARDSLFRIASISKLITAIAIMQLVEEGLINLDAPAFSYLNHLPMIDGGVEDPRLADVTVRHLLTHSGGWDSNVSLDPMFRNIEVAAAFGIPGPAEVEQIIQWMRGFPLDSDPGSRYAYSNFGFALLGRVIESVTGQEYETWVTDEVLAPMGIDRMQIGGSLLEDRVEGEVRYYGPNGAVSVFPDHATAPWAYGGFYLESLDSHGGWIASTLDLTRLLLSIDRRGAIPDALEEETIETMTARPDLPDWQGRDAWYAMGIIVRPAGDSATVWHDGSLPGTATQAVLTSNGFTWVALFNRRSDTEINDFHAELDQVLWDAYFSVDQWPEYDLMESYLPR
jgi:N-acyl-D-amino-acid deacylase